MGSIYYVYEHVDPRSGEIVYIGMGSGGRAWDVSRDRNHHKNHLSWMKELMFDGYIPSDWVNILAKNLDQISAREKEVNEIHNHGNRTRFNRQSGERQHQAKLTDKQALEVFTLKTQGFTHKEIAKKFGVSRPAISMILSGKNWRAITKGVRVQYGR